MNHHIELPDRLGSRSRDEIALPTGNAHIAQTTEIFNPLDAFGHQRGIADFAEILHRTHKVVFDPVIGNAIDKMLVDLDELGAQLRPHTQVGKTLAQIINGELKATPPVLVEHFLNTGHIGNLLVFGQFDHDPVGRNAQFAKQIAHLAIAHAFVEQAIRGHVQK